MNNNLTRGLNNTNTKNSIDSIISNLTNLIITNNISIQNSTIINNYNHNYKFNNNLLETLILNISSTDIFSQFQENPINIKQSLIIDINSQEKNNNNISKIFKNEIINNNIYGNNSLNKSNHNMNINSSQINNNDIYALIIGIIFPIIFILFILLLIYFCIKRKRKLNNNAFSNHNDLNKIKIKTSGSKLPYKKIQNTSKLNILNSNNISMSEIKVQNFKSDINNILSNSGNSSSSRRKREKNINNNKNIMDNEKQKEVQNEIKEQIKKYVIDEHINN